MLKQLQLKNTGPIPNLDIEFADRINLLTGDNGLGKSFIMDIAWWALTRKWPQEVNSKLTCGYMARPTDPKKDAEIIIKVKGKIKTPTETSVSFNRNKQSWIFPQAKPTMPGLVIYAQPNGGFAVWDPARNYSEEHSGAGHDRQPAYIFDPQEVWDGLKKKDDKPVCNGLVSDWSGWQKENGSAFEHLCKVLKALSPSENENIVPGKLTRVSLDDARDIPTIKMPYGIEVPVIYASAGMKRIISLAYLLVWAWAEHVKSCDLLGIKTTKQLIMLIDEIEAHLHPKWQRTISSALLSVVNSLKKELKVQLIIATHSPLVMASLEPTFDAKKDAWFDIDIEQNKVVLISREFEKHGDATNWLTSEAFDLKSTRSIESAKLTEEASALIQLEIPDKTKVKAIYEKLVLALSPKDDFLFVWRSICQKRELLK